METIQKSSEQYIPPRVKTMAVYTRYRILTGSNENIHGYLTGSDNDEGEDMNEGGW